MSETLETPTQEIVKAANKQTVIEDASGRKIILKRPRTHVKYELRRLAGDGATNEQYLLSLLPLFWVVAVGDYFVPPFKTREDIYNLSDMLGDEGEMAVGEYVAQEYLGDSPEAMNEDVKKK